ncbi:MAG TPA: type II toxin-antitoxin system RelE/ParE family toxin [Polyangia bacterium]|nr:type II toxin-antitoxin system RelE/ParE family toxin [Polyangia bacterium]
MKIVFAPESVEDLAAAAEYVQGRDPQVAVAMADNVFRVIDRLAAGEFEGPELELRRSGEKVRSWPSRPFRIHYRREGENLIVLRIYHSSRRPITR